MILLLLLIAFVFGHGGHSHSHSNHKHDHSDHKKADSHAAHDHAAHGHSAHGHSDHKETHHNHAKETKPSEIDKDAAKLLNLAREHKVVGQHDHVHQEALKFLNSLGHQNHKHDGHHNHKHDEDDDDDHDHSHGHDGKRSKNEIWLYAILSTIFVGLAPIVILFFVPLGYGGKGEGQLLKSLLGFAVGGLLGDVFLHLIPHALNPHDHDDHDHDNHKHDEHDHSKGMIVGLFVLLGIIVFFVIEKYVRLKAVQAERSAAAKKKKNDDAADQR